MPRTPPPDDFVSALQAEIQQLFASRPDISMEEAQRMLGAHMSGYNDRPQEELGGLSPSQVRALLADDWEGAGSAPAQ